MIKYWNPRRIQREKLKKIRAEKHAIQKARILHEMSATYSRGDLMKNATLMLEELGLSLRRKMVSRLLHGGAMSVSKLAEPFHITLPAALQHVRMLERSGILTTHKRGRIRICVFNRVALKELADFLVSKDLRFGE